MWIIDVRAGSYFQSLASRLGGSDIHVYAGEDSETGHNFQASSPHADKISSPGPAGKRIYSLNVILNGALRVSGLSLSQKPVTFSRFWDSDRGSVHRVETNLLEERPLSDEPPSDANNTKTEWGPEVHRVSHLLHLSKRHESVRHILIFAGLLSQETTIEKIHSWNMLYRIYESIRHFCNQYGWDLHILVGEDDLNRFTGACNNMSAVGLYARHGVTNRSAPSDYISDLRSASKVILEMAERFLDKVIEEKHEQ